MGIALMAGSTDGASAAKLAKQRAWLKRMEIRSGQLKPLALETAIVGGGQARSGS